MGDSGWIAETVSKDGDQSYSAWSPDGNYDLIVSPSWGGTSSATLVKTSGEIVRDYKPADHAVWLDDRSFMILRYKGDYENVAVIGSVDDAVVSPADVPNGSALANGHGAVAFTTTDSYDGPDCGFCANAHGFSVWQSGSTSNPREGDAVAWSPDGSLLYVLHDVRDLKPGTGAPAADDFVGWLEMLSVPRLDSVRKYADSKITDRFVSLDPSGDYVLYETVDDRNGVELAHVLDLATGHEAKFDVPFSSFAWNASQKIVVGPDEATSEIVYDRNGLPAGVDQTHGVATLRDAAGNATGEWADVGAGLDAAADGRLIATYDTQFIDSYAFVTLFAGDVRTTPDPLPIDGYMADGCWASVAPAAAAISAHCSLIPPTGGARYGLTAVYPLN